MLYLLLSLLAASTMSLVFKFSGKAKRSSDAIILVNYASAVLFSLLSLPGKKEGPVLTFRGIRFSSLLQNGDPGTRTLLSLLFGLVLGVIFVDNLVKQDQSIRANGAGITTFFSKAGFLGSTLLNCILWQDFPSPLQTGGIALVTAGLLLMCLGLKGLKADRPLLFLNLFVNYTLVQLMYKVFGLYSLPEYRPFFMCVVYATALLSFLRMRGRDGTLRKTLREVKAPELLSGTVLGAANVYNSVLQLKALETLRSSVVFPTYAVGSLLLMYGIEKGILREKTSAGELLAVLLAAAGLVLVNV